MSQFWAAFLSFYFVVIFFLKSSKKKCNQSITHLTHPIRPPWLLLSGTLTLCQHPPWNVWYSCFFFQHKDSKENVDYSNLSLGVKMKIGMKTFCHKKRVWTDSLNCKAALHNCFHSLLFLWKFFQHHVRGNVSRTRLLYTAAIMQMEITPFEHGSKRALHTYFGNT